KMEKLPISYFDRNAHGDIMSRYTNDVDAIRQFVTQTLLQTCQALITIVFVFIMMLYFSLWLALVSIVSTFIILHITKKIGGNSAKYSMAMQQSTGKAEGYIEEMMNGQKVVKSFNHEELAKADFDIINDKLCEDSYKANYYGNILGPILNNFGNIIYILIAIVGVILSVNKATNIGIGAMVDSTLALVTVGTVATFLGMSKQFTQTINNVSQQLPMIALAMAGGARIFQLMDQEPEVDEGYVTLVKANIDEDGNITETEERTHKWAWKYTHKTSGVTEYRELKGDILLDNVDFGYYPDKLVLHNIDIYAHPGQQIALVGATGAGKTTITNLINRFYDIADGKVRYDGININKIKKDDLRRSLAIVLQETSLFTGTVKENIRYGRLDATDEEVYEAAKTANAYDFITRLPNGFDTMLTHNGANLSQGQRQLIAIARAACADAPVMILDEATSSIDTRTEALVQEGMDKLMEGRTTFVIAHRLSTVRNSDCIMVLDQGRIIERGSHDDLIAKRGTYYQLYTGAFELE
nr:ABC transporter ATP-binding protein/permease [Acholeplasmatales bacterium]